MQSNSVKNKEHQSTLAISIFHMGMTQNSICSSFEAFLPVL